jgi:tetratricopeptide (TPR) repeat protein
MKRKSTQFRGMKLPIRPSFYAFLKLSQSYCSDLCQNLICMTRIKYILLSILCCLIFSSNAQIDKIKDLVLEGSIQTKEGNYNEALKFYNEALVLSPENFYIFQLKSQVYYIVGNYKLAKSNIERSLKLNPEDEESSYLAALIFRTEENYSQALSYVNKALEAIPDDQRFLLLKAHLLIDNEQFDEAEIMASKLSKDKSDAYTEYILARVAFEKGDYKRCIQLCESGSKKQNDIDFHGLSTQAHMKIKDYRNGATTAARAVIKSPYNISNHDNMCKLYHITTNSSVSLDANDYLKFDKATRAEILDIVLKMHNEFNNRKLKKLRKRIVKENELLPLDDYLFVLLGTELKQNTEKTNRAFSRELLNLKNENRPDAILELCKEYQKDDSFLPQSFKEEAYITMDKKQINEGSQILMTYNSFIMSMVASGDGLTPATAYIAPGKTNSKLLLEYLNIEPEKSISQFMNNMNYKLISYRKDGKAKSLWIIEEIPTKVRGL